MLEQAACHAISIDKSQTCRRPRERTASRGVQRSRRSGCAPTTIRKVALSTPGDAGAGLHRLQAPACSPATGHTTGRPASHPGAAPACLGPAAAVAGARTLHPRAPRWMATPGVHHPAAELPGRPPRRHAGSRALRRSARGARVRGPGRRGRRCGGLHGRGRRRRRRRRRRECPREWCGLSRRCRGPRRRRSGGAAEPDASNPIAVRAVAANALLTELAQHDFTGTAFCRSFAELAAADPGRHVASIRSFRETASIEAQAGMPGVDVVTGRWLDAYVEVTIDRASGTARSVRVEVDGAQRRHIR